MDAKKTGGPDMMKMLHMMLPYMDSSTKRMLSIMMKLRELQELMEVKEERSVKEQETEEVQQEKPQFSGSQPPLVVQEHNLTSKLQEGLTPEQQSMITSLTGMLG